MRAPHLAWITCFCLAAGAVACEERERPPPFVPPPSAPRDSDRDDLDPGNDCERPPEPDDSSFCGNELVPILIQKPNLYFVLDVSGSMALPMDGGATTRLDVAKTALIRLLHDLGHRINYGLAVFPGGGPDPAGDGACAAGSEVFATQEGDPVACVNRRRTGPVLHALTRVLNPIAPVGGTPLAASLDNLRPLMANLEGTTAVVLITDGAPNCALMPCGVDECGPNLEDSFFYMGQRCDDTFNCCDPEMVDYSLAALNCVDRTGSVAAVAALAELGVKTYVVGIPGSEFFVDVLNQLAEAGGTAQEGARKYFAINDGAALQRALSTIGTNVAVTCELTINDGRYEPALTNVYFDASVVPASESDGWTFEEHGITIHGTYCDELLSGNVLQVQVVSGCPTLVR